MKKIPTLFERDWNGDRSRVVNQVHAGCEWVIAGEGTPTQKLDGTSCMIRGGKLYKRRELRRGDKAPDNFEQIDFDEETGKTVGWVPVGDGPEDRYHREAFEALVKERTPVNGTYELLGPKVQGNVEQVGDAHMLVEHGTPDDHAFYPHNLASIPRDFEGLSSWLAGKDIEGIVWHHPDGRMAKIKLRDFGLKRSRS